MPLRQAEITRHAWLRFLKRWPGEPPACYRTELIRLVAAAGEENLGYGAVVRLLQNNYVPAKYFISEGWRFVTDEEVTTVLTIERAYIVCRKTTGNRTGHKRRRGD